MNTNNHEMWQLFDERAGIKSGIFPTPIKLAGGRCCAWRSEEIDKLIEDAK